MYISEIIFLIFDIKLVFSIYLSYNNFKKGGYQLCYASFHFRISNLTKEKPL